MQSHAKPIHAVEVFDCRPIALQCSSAVAAGIPESLKHGKGIIWIRYSEIKTAGKSSANFMQEHANQLISDVGLGSASCPPKIG